MFLQGSRHETTSILGRTYNIAADYRTGHFLLHLPNRHWSVIKIIKIILSRIINKINHFPEQLRKNAQQKVLPDQSDKNDVVETIEKIWNLTKELKDVRFLIESPSNLF
jgi:hypothetical protein